VNLSSNVFADDTLNSESAELIKFVAMDYAKQFYPEMGDLTVYDMETYYDLEGVPAVKAVILTNVEEVYLPSLSEIKEKIKNLNNTISSLKKDINDIKDENVSGKVKSIKISEKRKEIHKINTEISGNDSFLTVICGASESRPPVLKLFKGLPEHLTAPSVLFEKQEVHEFISGKVVKRTFFIGMFDLAFEFGTTEEVTQFKLNKIRGISPTAKLVHSRSGKIINVSEFKSLLAKPEKGKDLEESISVKLERRKKSWDRLRGRYKQYMSEKDQY